MSKAKTSRHAPEEIDAYLAEQPDDIHDSLERVRGIIRETAPICAERVSYRIPIFRLQKDLVGLSVARHHCSLHTMSPSLVKAMTDDLKGIIVSGATIHFTPENPLIRELIGKIVQERMKEIGGTQQR
jgi:uncharacterized protein YdhG (YjbR/CyaY superfamily)